MFESILKKVMSIIKYYTLLVTYTTVVDYSTIFLLLKMTWNHLIVAKVQEEKGWFVWILFQSTQGADNWRTIVMRVIKFMTVM